MAMERDTVEAGPADSDPPEPGTDLIGSAFYGPVRFTGDAVAGNKIINVAAAPPPRPAQLPPGLPDFIGRRAALRNLDALRDSGNRPGMSIAVIHGMPGIGKTALAVHWSHRVHDRFPDGQLFVELSGRPSRSSVSAYEALAQLLRALGVPTGQIPASQTERAALYRSQLADRRVLLVLDDAASVGQIKPLLPGSDTCVTVITSRDRLTGLVARHSARSVWLGLLAPAESLGLLTAVLGRGRVTAEPRAARELAGLCAHHPMALRIIAANLAVNPRNAIGDAARELTRGGDLLAGLTLNGDPHEAVGAAFDTSYEDLGHAQRRAFRHLGLLDRIDFSREAAAALFGVSPRLAARLLHDLERANLIETPAPGHYRLSDLLHGYAERRVREEESEHDRQAAMRRLTGWLRSRAEQSLNAVAHAYDLLGDDVQAARFRELARAAAAGDIGLAHHAATFTL